MASRRRSSSTLKLDAKVITAIGAVLLALAGGVELRVQVGMLAAKMNQVESRVMRIEQAMGVYNLPTELANSDR